MRRVSPDKIAVTAGDGSTYALTVTPNKGYDMKSLLPYLKEGTQLNLINTTANPPNGTLSAELVIFEPDYLFDITGVAECFETYCTSPEISLVKRIKPESVTRHI
ncbi:MAG: hypothetical protein K2F70_07310, partial [Muribaculaceae bacterium]|nr:hypothetical protein [Muribaculaceae bacterium]